MKKTGKAGLPDRNASKTKAGSLTTRKVQLRDLDVQKGNSVKGGFIDFGGLQAKSFDSSVINVSRSAISPLK